MKYVYWVSYLCGDVPDIPSLGSAEVVLSKPISEFDDVVGMGKVIAADVGVETVAVLNWKLLRGEVNQDDSSD